MARSFNRKLVLQEAVRVPDGAGGYELTWQPLGTVWADIRSGTGRETALELVAASQVNLKITLRSAPVGSPARPKPDQRFVEGTRVYRILAVTEADADGFLLTCIAREEVLA